MCWVCQKWSFANRKTVCELDKKFCEPAFDSSRTSEFVNQTEIYYPPVWRLAPQNLIVDSSTLFFRNGRVVIIRWKDGSQVSSIATRLLLLKSAVSDRLKNDPLTTRLRPGNSLRALSVLLWWIYISQPPQDTIEDFCTLSYRYYPPWGSATVRFWSSGPLVSKFSSSLLVPQISDKGEWSESRELSWILRRVEEAKEQDGQTECRVGWLSLAPNLNFNFHWQRDDVYHYPALNIPAPY